MAEIMILDGYTVPKFSKSHSTGGRKMSAKQKAHQRRFAAASRACKGKGKGARKACMRKHLKSKR